MKLSFSACILACLALMLPCSVVARPGLWAVKDADTTIYLFGTVHLLPQDTDWRFPALENALDSSQKLYIELTDDNQATMTALVLHYGMDVGQPLSGKLTHSENVALGKAAEAAGIPGGGTALQPMRPWLAALTLSVAPLMKAGLDPANGVDKLLKAQEEKAGRPVLGMETSEQQIRFLADMTPAMELAFLRSTLKDIDKGTIELKQIIEAWKDGDVATIGRLEDEEMRRSEPQLYETLLVDRNKAWAGKIAAMLQQPGTIFIAVGAAHLAGPDSVQSQLQQLGFTVERQ
jgi:uncharacterized protein YbaP (TraB family)